MKARYEIAEMTDVDTGHLKGYIPEELDIWIPPTFKSIEGLTLQSVVLEGEGEGARLVFFVPRDWVIRNQKSGWKTRLKEIGWIKKEDTSKLLDQFIALSEATPDRFIAFAKKWGPLWKQSNQFAEKENMLPKDYETAPWIEPIEIWRLHARLVNSVLNIASYLNQYSPEPAPLGCWKALFLRDENYLSFIEKAVPPLETFKESRFDTIEKQKKELMNYINIEMLNHRVKFYIDWQGEVPELKIGSTLGFLSAVWFQLMQTITKQAICCCNGCGKVYVRNGRKPQAGRNNYCDICGIAGARSDYERRNPGRKNR
jgi:hypothetical protein